MTEDGKIKILQFPITNRQGGMTQYILQNWRNIDKKKFHFDFATMSKKLDYEEALTACGAKVHYISCYAEENKELFIQEFTNILLYGNYDIVQLHTKWWKSFLVEEIAKKAGVKKIIVHAHSTGFDVVDLEKKDMEMSRHNQIKSQINESIATDFWACSKAAAEFLYGDRISADKIKIMNNAIDLSRFAFHQEIRDDVRKELNIAEDEFIIGHIGRLSYAKNHEFLLKVFKEVCKNRDDCRLLLVGDGERKDSCLRYIHENNLSDKVLFLGFRKDPNRLLQAMDVFCLPSRFEGFPMAVVEAHTSGVKCIISNTITDEVVLSNRVIQIPLKEDLWIDELQREYRVDRYAFEEITRSKGYSVQRQIKILEQEYESVTRKPRRM